MFPPPFFAREAESIKKAIPNTHPGILKGIKKNMMGIVG
jgi:hypothetical protein